MSAADTGASAALLDAEARLRTPLDIPSAPQWLDRGAGGRPLRVQAWPEWQACEPHFAPLRFSCGDDGSLEAADPGEADWMPFTATAQATLMWRWHQEAAARIYEDSRGPHDWLTPADLPGAQAVAVVAGHAAQDPPGPDGLAAHGRLDASAPDGAAPSAGPGVPARCSRTDDTGRGCWLTQDHGGDCEPDGSKVAATTGNGPSCRHCGQPLIRWVSRQWADASAMTVCEVTPGRFRAHEPATPLENVPRPGQDAERVPGRSITGQGHQPRWAEASRDEHVNCICDAYGMCPQGCPQCSVCSGEPDVPGPENGQGHGVGTGGKRAADPVTAGPGRTQQDDEADRIQHAAEDSLRRAGVTEQDIADLHRPHDDTEAITRVMDVPEEQQ